jgi:hypothetical protein
MSVVIRESHATNDQPLWLGAGGGTITGNLFVDGSVRAEGNVSTKVVIILDNSDTPVGGVYKRSVADGDGANGILLQGEEIQFGRLGTGTFNSKLVTSAGGSNLDVLAVGGAITATGNITATGLLNGIGPVPIASVPTGSTQSITLSTGTATRSGVWPVVTPIVPVANAEYDVQASGFFTLTAGTAPVAGDFCSVNVSTGPGFNSSVNQGIDLVNNFTPMTALNDTVPFNIRARITAPASPAGAITVTGYFSGNAATGTISGSLTLFDVVRVA